MHFTSIIPLVLLTATSTTAAVLKPPKHSHSTSTSSASDTGLPSYNPPATTITFATGHFPSTMITMTTDAIAGGKHTILHSSARRVSVVVDKPAMHTYTVVPSPEPVVPVPFGHRPPFHSHSLTAVVTTTVVAMEAGDVGEKTTTSSKKKNLATTVTFESSASLRAELHPTQYLPKTKL